MTELLSAVSLYLPLFKGIRISTRPDGIDDEILTLLKQYGVSAIELGAQSMSDEVLLSNERGHNADDVRRACELIKAYGYELGLQMMTGLYRSTPQTDLYTAKEFVKLHPAVVRIYPTVVMKNTCLEELYDSGEYIPQTLENAIGLCAELLDLFEENGIRVIRVGLHHTDSLDRDRIAGPYHPAFRELCESERIFKFLIKKFDEDQTTTLTVAVSPRTVSKLTGNKKSNLHRLSELGYHIHIIQDESFDDGQIHILQER